MAFDGEIGLVADRFNLLNWEANVNFDDTVAICAGQVMMVAATADAVMVRAVGELDAVQQADSDQHLNGAVDGGTSQARLALPQLLPQVIDGEVVATTCKLYQPIRDKLTRARLALARFGEGGANFFCNGMGTVFCIHRLHYNINSFFV